MAPTSSGLTELQRKLWQGPAEVAGYMPSAYSAATEPTFAEALSSPRSELPRHKAGHTPPEHRDALPTLLCAG